MRHNVEADAVKRARKKPRGPELLPRQARARQHVHVEQHEVLLGKVRVRRVGVAGRPKAAGAPPALRAAGPCAPRQRR